MSTIKDYFEAMFSEDPELKDWEKRTDADPNKRRCYGSPYADGCDCCPQLFECEAISDDGQNARTLRGVVVIKEEQ